LRKIEGSPWTVMPEEEEEKEEEGTVSVRTFVI
jgi:hypothetical protein